MKILLFANTDWYLFNFRRSLAEALRSAGHEILLISPSGPYGERLQDLGFRWLPAPMDRRSLNPLRETALLLWLWRLVRKENVDLVHGFTIKCAIYGSLAARLARVPARVNAVAGMGYVFTSQQPLARLLRPIVRLLMRLALDGEDARLILQNPDDVSLFEQARLIQPGRVRLIPGSGVDCSRFVPSAATRCDIDSGPFRVVLPARLLWDKGIAEYVQAARLLRAEGLPVEFLLAGAPDVGNPASVPLPAIQGWVEEGVLQWLGHVEDMPALFQSVHVAVLPSYREGLPKGLIEAAACALPVITTDVPGCRTVVTHIVDGLLIPARDARALAQAVKQLIEDRELREKLGAAARKKVLEEFDERIVVEKTMGVYAELLQPAPTEYAHESK
ncbi:glycosyltransferase family 4 protein [Ramlibacter sp. USB13]|uniref:Glycosyltransferase family 4 protein n=1 Tax=Ramlibacter cellulosilyticus TaxID=2764187 RepID=A0A923MTS0_9BURK|nr:glycosyltransferase family 4 protein [Ramlibacter cellulosilyticus]MBC5784866.1 glycosyltransferase family 4 protein [Ramlibacter cellulosilyticus]